MRGDTKSKGPCYALELLLGTIRSTLFLGRNMKRFVLDSLVLFRLDGVAVRNKYVYSKGLTFTTDDFF